MATRRDSLLAFLCCFGPAFWVGAFAVPLGGCGPALPEYEIVRSAGGNAIKLERKKYLPLDGGGFAFVLSYRTDLAMDDRDALRAEVDEVWRTFQQAAEDRGAQTALIEARTLVGERWSRIGRSRRFAFQRSPSGSWKLIERGAARTTAVKPL